jgi:hypothetical protein
MFSFWECNLMVIIIILKICLLVCNLWFLSSWVIWVCILSVN